MYVLGVNPEACAFVSMSVKSHDVVFQLIQRLLEVYHNPIALHGYTVF